MFTVSSQKDSWRVWCLFLCIKCHTAGQVCGGSSRPKVLGNNSVSGSNCLGCHWQVPIWHCQTMENFKTDILSQGQSIKWGHEVPAREVVKVNCWHERQFDIFSHLKGLVDHQKGDRGKNILQVCEVQIEQIQGGFFDWSRPKSCKCWRWQNPYQKSEIKGITEKLTMNFHFFSRDSAIFNTLGRDQ